MYEHSFKSITVNDFLPFQIEGWPGKNIKTTVTARDQLGKPCGSLTHLVFSPNEVVSEYEVNLCLLSLLRFMVISFIKHFDLIFSSQLKIKSAKLNYIENSMFNEHDHSS